MIPSGRVPDFALVLTPTVDGYVADLELVDDDLRTDDGLLSSLLLSLYCDRRAVPDDVIPDGTANLRGWWADENLPNENDLFGSRLWLLSRTTAQQDNAVRARGFLVEATQWLLDDAIADGVDIEVEQLEGDALCYVVKPIRPDETDTEFRFPHVWSENYGV